MRTCERGKGGNRRTTEKHRNEEDWKVQAKNRRGDKLRNKVPFH